MNVLPSHLVWLACLLVLAHETHGEDVFASNPRTGDGGHRDTNRGKRSDDVSFAALQSVIEQQASVVQQLQADVTALTTDLAATKNELATTASQLTTAKNDLATTESDLAATKSEVATIKQSLPSTFSPVAFSVRFSQDSQEGIAHSVHATLMFDTIITNIGNAYNVHTGIFTAPFSGVYCFYITFMSPNGHGDVTVGLMKDGVLLDIAYANSNVVYDQGSTEVNVHLASGEQVWARLEHGVGVRGNHLTIFSGHLVQAD